MFYVLLYVTLCPFEYCNHLDGKERAGWFAKYIFLVSRDGNVALPRGAMGLFAVCDCGISLSYSLFLLFYVPPIVCGVIFVLVCITLYPF